MQTQSNEPTNEAPYEPSLLDRALKAGQVSTPGAVKLPPPRQVERPARAISAAIHPDLVPSDTPAHEALGKARTVLEGAAQHEAAIENDPTLPREARLVANYEAWTGAAQRARAIIASALEVNLTACAALEKRISEGFAPDKFAAEIRQHVRSLPPEKRLSFVNMRATAGDVRSLAAILGDAPLFLSGLDGLLTEQGVKDLRLHALRRQKPDLVLDLKAAEERRERLQAALYSVNQYEPNETPELRRIRERRKAREIARAKFAA